MNSDTNLRAMKIASKKMDISESKFAENLKQRMLADESVPKELKERSKNIQSNN